MRVRQAIVRFDCSVPHYPISAGCTGPTTLTRSFLTLFSFRRQDQRGDSFCKDFHVDENMSSSVPSSTPTSPAPPPSMDVSHSYPRESSILGLQDMILGKSDCGFLHYRMFDWVELNGWVSPDIAILCRDVNLQRCQMTFLFWGKKDLLEPTRPFSVYKICQHWWATYFGLVWYTRYSEGTWAFCGWPCLTYGASLRIPTHRDSFFSPTYGYSAWTERWEGSEANVSPAFFSLSPRVSSFWTLRPPHKWARHLFWALNHEWILFLTTALVIFKKVKQRIIANLTDVSQEMGKMVLIKVLLKFKLKLLNNNACSCTAVLK